MTTLHYSVNHFVLFTPVTTTKSPIEGEEGEKIRDLCFKRGFLSFSSNEWKQWEKLVSLGIHTCVDE